MCLQLVLENKENPADHWRRSSTGEPLYNLLLKKTCVRHSQQKVLQGLRRSADCTMRNSNSSAWMINSLCVLCAEIQKNMSITDSAPSVAVKCIIQKYVLLLCRYRFLCCFFLLRLSLSSVSGKLRKHLINFMSFCNLKNKLQSLHLERRKSR